MGINAWFQIHTYLLGCLSYLEKLIICECLLVVYKHINELNEKNAGRAHWVTAVRKHGARQVGPCRHGAGRVVTARG